MAFFRDSGKAKKYEKSNKNEKSSKYEKSNKNEKSSKYEKSNKNEKSKGKRPPGRYRSVKQEKGNSASYVLMRIEQCINVATGASSVKIVSDKLYEASGYIAELMEIEKKGLYKGTPHAKDFVKSFVQRKDIILMEGIKRAFAAGETKEQILACDKFLNDEMKEYIKNQ